MSPVLAKASQDCYLSVVSQSVPKLSLLHPHVVNGTSAAPGPLIPPATFIFFRQGIDGFRAHPVQADAELEHVIILADDGSI